jgi:metal-responsive CopG/Arc/MetJ family transcriptional regulator
MSTRARAKGNALATRRASISLPAALHRELEQLAKQKKVSLAWVIREAAEAYVKERYPLFANRS